jgi:hypothetical protein
MKLEKGSLIFELGVWYVVVVTDSKNAYCICDHANNIYSTPLKTVEFTCTAREAMYSHGWGISDHVLQEYIDKRPIPVDVIAEVLSGCHDDRFEHLDLKTPESKDKNV